MPVLAIYVPNTVQGHQNLEHAIKTRRWGFRKDRPEYSGVEPRTLVLIATGYSHSTMGNSPRKQPEQYVQGSIARIMVFRAESRVTHQNTFHWPDEVQERQVKYPHRLTLTPLYEIHNVELAKIPFELADAFRYSALTQGAGKPVLDSPFTLAIEQGQLPPEVSLSLSQWPEDLAGIGAYLARTDNSWVQTLREQAVAHAEIAHWRPVGSQHAPLPIGPGEPYVFARTPEPGSATGIRAAVGAGVFSGVSRMLLSELWEWFQFECGARSHKELRAQYATRTGAPLEAAADPEVESLLLRDVRFFSETEELAVQVEESDFVLTGGRYFDLGTLANEHPMLRAILTYFHPTADDTDDEVTQLVLTRIRGQAKLVTPRLGQGAFRAMVSEAYNHRCALTGEKVRPVLEAAHIKSFSSGGEYRMDNGLLLRSDMHTLYDRGYISFDVDRSLMVSPQLREKFGNGDWLYSRAGTPIAIPTKAVDRPNLEFLQWHRDSVFLGA